MPTLLLADDSVTIQRVIELTFANEDVRVVAVGDGQAALQKLEADRPDIVLADVGMWDTPAGPQSGITEGIDDRGGLLVRVAADRVERIVAGEVRWI